ncbi:MAG: NAD kinase, partial [Betaproteobacteria bacterium]|nr:NAD kinase [Betaproteobacteria bacterium]
MPLRFEKIALVGRPQTSGLDQTLSSMVTWLRLRGVEVLAEASLVSGLGLTAVRSVSFADIATIADLVVSVGGDGTLLGAARQIGPKEVPLLGINHGRVGFVTDIPLSQWEQGLQTVLDGDYAIERRGLISATVTRDGVRVWSTLAVNDVVVNRSSRAGMIELEVEVDGEHMATQRADGLIVASPTGSTAYALSANGPILHPRLHGFILVPIAPQSLSNRPICLPDDVSITIRVVEGREPRVSGDMQVFSDLHIDDDIHIQRAPHAMRLVHPKGYSYFGTLRSK